MYIDLKEEEARLVIKLLEEDLDEISPEIRRSATGKMRAELREDRRLLKELLDRLYALKETETRWGKEIDKLEAL